MPEPGHRIFDYRSSILIQRTILRPRILHCSNSLCCYSFRTAERPNARTYVRAFIPLERSDEGTETSELRLFAFDLGTAPAPVRRSSRRQAVRTPAARIRLASRQARVAQEQKGERSCRLSGQFQPAAYKGCRTARQRDTLETPGGIENPRAEEPPMAQLIRRYSVKFARTGDPGGDTRGSQRAGPSGRTF